MSASSPAEKCDLPQPAVLAISEISSAIHKLILDMQSRCLLLVDNPDDVFDRTLRYLRAYVRSTISTTVDKLTLTSWKSLLLLKAYKVLCPHPGDRPSEHSIPSAPSELDASEYRFRLNYRPKFHVGGDEVLFRETNDGSKWMMVADVAGKGVAAHLTAKSLRVLWRIGHEQAVANEPLCFLDWLESQFSEYKPEHVFIETVMVRAQSGGLADIVAAGAIVFLTGNMPSRVVNVHRIGGMYFGCGNPGEFSSVRIMIPVDHEIVLATDGVFDQEDTGGLGNDGATTRKRLRSILRDRILELPASESIHAAVVQVTEQTLKQHGQLDDISVASIQRLK